MTHQQIETALGQRLAGMASAPPVAWPSIDYNPTGPNAVPYLEFVHSPVARVDESNDGGFTRQIGLVLVTVVVERGKFTSAANVLAEAVAARFHKALRLVAGAGNVVINAPAEIAPGFTDGIYWRVPVRVSYVTEG